jgi:hypothetical protein
LRAQEAGWYGGASAGLSNIAVTEGFWSDNSISRASIQTSGFGYGLHAGYRFNPRFALEVDYLQAADTRFDAVSNGSLTIWPPGQVYGTTLSDGTILSGMLFWPARASRVQLYLKGGLFFWDTTTRYSNTINVYNEFNDNGTSPIGGAGIQIQLAHQWNLRVEALYSMVQLARRASVGASFAFAGVSRSFSIP